MMALVPGMAPAAESGLEAHDLRHHAFDRRRHLRQEVLGKGIIGPGRDGVDQLRQHLVMGTMGAVDFVLAT